MTQSYRVSGVNGRQVTEILFVAPSLFSLGTERLTWHPMAKNSEIIIPLYKEEELQTHIQTKDIDSSPCP